jgi:sugar lactone lactonase YvrE
MPKPPGPHSWPGQACDNRSGDRNCRLLRRRQRCPPTELNEPWGLAIDSTDNLFIADASNHRVRKVSPDGTITTVAGVGTAGLSGDGSAASAAQLDHPIGVAVDSQGNLFIVEIGDFFGVNKGYRVRKVDANGIISTVAGSDKRGFTGDGGPATAARLNTPTGVAVDSAGNLFIGDEGNRRVRKVDSSGIISTVAGNGTTRYGLDGALATAAGVGGTTSLAVDAAGNLLITGTNDRVLKVYGVAAPGLIAGQLFPSP